MFSRTVGKGTMFPRAAMVFVLTPQKEGTQKTRELPRWHVMFWFFVLVGWTWTRTWLVMVS